MVLTDSEMKQVIARIVEETVEEFGKIKSKIAKVEATLEKLKEEVEHYDDTKIAFYPKDSDYLNLYKYIQNFENKKQQGRYEGGMAEEWLVDSYEMFFENKPYNELIREVIKDAMGFDMREFSDLGNPDYVYNIAMIRLENIMFHTLENVESTLYRLKKLESVVLPQIRKAYDYIDSLDAIEYKVK